MTKAHMYKRVTIKPLDRVGLFEVLLDGEPVKGVTKVDVSMAVDWLPAVTLTIRAQEVDAELLFGSLEARIEGTENTQ